jgi:uncharacterized repeat protein (TIGR03803 family)
VEGAEGNFYGTTMAGGGQGDGTGSIFRITPGGALTTLDTFDYCGNWCGVLLGGLAVGSNGLFYGGSAGISEGNLFQMASDGTFTVLCSLTPGCTATLLFATDGNLYGLSENGGTDTNGLVFCLTTNGSLTFIYSFTNGLDGGNPGGPLIQGGDGALYGTTTSGGANGLGTVFKLTTNGILSVLHSFNVFDGAQANGLLLGNDGNYYGTTAAGAYDNNGTVFRLTPDGRFCTLIYFDGTNGANPQAALIQADDGTYYGTTAFGGSNNAGTVFKLAVPPGLGAISQSNGMVSFSFSAVVGQTYQVQYTSNLTLPIWQNLGSPIQAAFSSVAFTDAIVAQQRFYRIVQLPGQ